MRLPPKVTRRRMAGPDHAVATLEGGAKLYRREPCATCPWRVDTVGEFPPEAFRHSANTALDAVAAILHGRLGDASHLFACHESGAEKPATCAGYILGGDQGIGWRIAVSLGVFDPREVRSDVPMFDSYRAMAIANGVPPDDPALEGAT